jgi:hypothetical protein
MTIHSQRPQVTSRTQGTKHSPKPHNAHPFGYQGHPIGGDLVLPPEDQRVRRITASWTTRGRSPRRSPTSRRAGQRIDGSVRSSPHSEGNDRIDTRRLAHSTVRPAAEPVPIIEPAMRTRRTPVAATLTSAAGVLAEEPATWVAHRGAGRSGLPVRPDSHTSPTGVRKTLPGPAPKRTTQSCRTSLWRMPGTGLMARQRIDPLSKS